MNSLPRRTLAGALLVTTAALCACVDLAPPYVRPPAPVPASWASGDIAPDPASDLADCDCDELVVDARLKHVVGLALGNNRDLRIALRRVDDARAQFRIQDASRVPTLAADASVTRAATAGVAVDSATLSVALPAYELDLFGRVRNESAARLQGYLATREGARAARLSLIAAVASAWLALAADADALRLADQSLALSERALALERGRHALGAVAALGVAQAQVARDAARGALAASRQALRQDRDALELLVGRPLPDDLLALQAFPTEATAPLAAASELPVARLAQRPDVLAAEHQLQAAHHDIGVARAARFPSISLAGSVGWGSSGARLFRGGAAAWSWGPAVTVPLFDGGAADAGVDAANAQRDIALATYEKTLQTAYFEVADAWAVRQDIARRLDAQQAQQQGSATTLRLTGERHRTGATGYLEVLDAQRTDTAIQQAGIALRLLDQQNRIALYKALGGPWKDPH